MDSNLYWLVVLPCFALLLGLYLKRSDPYGLFHLSLNKLPGEDPAADPKTEWLNMGYWKVSKSQHAVC